MVAKKTKPKLADLINDWLKEHHPHLCVDHLNEIVEVEELNKMSKAYGIRIYGVVNEDYVQFTRRVMGARIEFEFVNIKATDPKFFEKIEEELFP